ncbi:MAG: hypothetical protein AB2375_02275 [Tissierellaceae bacterium]
MTKKDCKVIGTGLKGMLIKVPIAVRDVNNPTKVISLLFIIYPSVEIDYTINNLPNLLHKY